MKNCGKYWPYGKNKYNMLMYTHYNKEFEWKAMQQQKSISYHSGLDGTKLVFTENTLLEYSFETGFSFGSMFYLQLEPTNCILSSFSLRNFAFFRK